MKNFLSLEGTFSEQFGKKNNCVNFSTGKQTYFVFLAEKQVVPVNVPVVAQFDFRSYLGVEKRDGEHQAYVGIRPTNLIKFDKQ